MDKETELRVATAIVADQDELAAISTVFKKILEYERDGATDPVEILNKTNQPKSLTRNALTIWSCVYQTQWGLDMYEADLSRSEFYSKGLL